MLSQAQTQCLQACDACALVCLQCSAACLAEEEGDRAIRPLACEAEAMRTRRQRYALKAWCFPLRSELA